MEFKSADKNKNQERKKLVDFSLTKEDIKHGRTHHRTELTASVAMAHQTKQFPNFRSVEKGTLPFPRHNDDDNNNDNNNDNDEVVGTKSQLAKEGSVHFLFKVPVRRNKRQDDGLDDKLKKRLDPICQRLAAMEKQEESQRHERSCRQHHYREKQLTPPNSPTTKKRRKRG